jgi:hypothetical protein
MDVLGRWTVRSRSGSIAYPPDRHREARQRGPGVPASRLLRRADQGSDAGTTSCPRGRSGLLYPEHPVEQRVVAPHQSSESFGVRLTAVRIPAGPVIVQGANLIPE